MPFVQRIRSGNFHLVHINSLGHEIAGKSLRSSRGEKSNDEGSRADRQHGAFLPNIPGCVFDADQAMNVRIGIKA
jgi:hypothetical protein